jgi:hypothetical protein
MNTDIDPEAGEKLKPASGILWAIFGMIALYGLFFWWLFTVGAPPEYPVRPHQRSMMVDHPKG